MDKIIDNLATDVDLQQLKLGSHHLNYQIDKAFFDSIEDSMIEDGNLIAKLDIEKGNNIIDIHCDIDGTIKAICDRCMEEMDYGVKCEDDIRIGVNDEEFDLAHWLYETICISLPLRIEHEEGQCNPESRDKVKQYIIN